MRETTTNECSQFIKRTDRKVFSSGLRSSAQHEKQIISSCPPLQLSSPTFLEKIAKIWRNHSRSIRQIPCTLQSSAWAAEENWHSRRSEGNEGNARLAAKLNNTVNIPFQVLDKVVAFELR